MSAVPKSRPTHPVPFPAKRNQIFGTGEMADLTRAFDWSRTSVGPIDQWPEALLTTVNTMLASRHPMFLWWGDDLVQFYNDGYRPSIREDKHPHALGQNGRGRRPQAGRRTRYNRAQTILRHPHFLFLILAFPCQARLCFLF